MTQTPAFYFDILEILSRGRCPGCELTRSKAMHYIDHALYGLVTDPHAQNQFADTGGYCRRHGEMLLKIPWGSALGVAILYNRLIEDAAGKLKAGGEGSVAGEKRGAPGPVFSPAKGRRKPLSRGDNPDCLACKVERETEQGVLHTLTESLRAGDQRMLEAVNGSEGFCLYHLDLALSNPLPEKVETALRRHGLRRAGHLLVELKEFMRKSDYRFTGEPMGSEGDSWTRAVAWVTGVSLEKEDVGSTPGELKRRMRGDD
ncbi:MAG: DUF6062 family protein [Anaerolineales bacterium]|jgi:hypothetical protein